MQQISLYQTFIQACISVIKKPDNSSKLTIPTTPSLVGWEKESFLLSQTQGVKDGSFQVLAWGVNDVLALLCPTLLLHQTGISYFLGNTVFEQLW